MHHNISEWPYIIYIKCSIQAVLAVCIRAACGSTYPRTQKSATHIYGSQRRATKYIYIYTIILQGRTIKMPLRVTFIQFLWTISSIGKETINFRNIYISATQHYMIRETWHDECCICPCYWLQSPAPTIIRMASRRLRFSLAITPILFVSILHQPYNYLSCVCKCCFDLVIMGRHHAPRISDVCVCASGRTWHQLIY